MSTDDRDIKPDNPTPPAPDRSEPPPGSRKFVKAYEAYQRAPNESLEEVRALEVLWGVIDSITAPAAAAPQGPDAVAEMWLYVDGDNLDINRVRRNTRALLRKIGALEERLRLLEPSHAAPSAPQGGPDPEAAADFHQDVGIAGFAEALSHTLRHYGFEEPQHHDVAVEELLTELWRLAKAYPYPAASPPQGERPPCKGSMSDEPGST